MTSKADRFLKAVEDAEALTKTLKKMKEEISAYNAAGKSLTSVRKDLKAQLQTTLEISEDMAELIEAMAAFGPEIIKTLQNNADRLRSLTNYAIGAAAAAAVIGIIGWFV